MVLPDSDGISRAPSYSGSTQEKYIFNYRIITFFDSSFQMIRLIYSFVTPYRVSTTPISKLIGLGFPVSLAATQGIDFFLFLRVLRCFSSPGLPSNMLCIHMSITQHNLCWVSPFGNLWINAYLQLPKAYRR